MKQKANKKIDNVKVAFIIGSSRSGTTILENILNCHPEIAAWYEPYYLWERYFSAVEDDVWQEEHLRTRRKEAIRREFGLFALKSQKMIVIDKLPTHVFNVRIIHKIFPHAKWIHIVRDGRDVTLSIKKEWDRRRRIVEKRSFIGILQTASSMLKRQPFWRYRIMATIYELASNASLNPLKYLNKSKWNGSVGWGPRFKGWKEYYYSHSSLEFNAMQWVKSVEAVRKIWSSLPEENKIEIRYEDLLMSPAETLSNVLNMLGVAPPADFFAKIPKLKKANFNKWAKEFTAEEISKIKPVLAPMINDLGYANPDEW